MHTSRDRGNNDDFDSIIHNFFKELQADYHDSQVQLIVKHYLLYLKSIIENDEKTETTLLLGLLHAYELKRGTHMNDLLINDVKRCGAIFKLFSKIEQQAIYEKNSVFWQATTPASVLVPVVYRSGLWENNLTDRQLYSGMSIRSSDIIIFLDHKIKIAIHLIEKSKQESEGVPSLHDAISVLKEIIFTDECKNQMLKSSIKKRKIEALVKKLMLSAMAYIDKLIAEEKEWDNALEATVLLIDFAQVYLPQIKLSLETVKQYIHWAEELFYCNDYAGANLLLKKTELLLNENMMEDVIAFNQMLLLVKNLHMFMHHDAAKIAYQHARYDVALESMKAALTAYKAMQLIYEIYPPHPEGYETVLDQGKALVCSLSYLHEILALQSWSQNNFEAAKDHLKKTQVWLDSLPSPSPGAKKDFTILSALLITHASVFASLQMPFTIEAELKLRHIAEMIHQLIDYCFSKLSKNMNTDLRNDLCFSHFKGCVVDAALDYSVHCVELHQGDAAKPFLTIARLLNASFEYSKQKWVIEKINILENKANKKESKRKRSPKLFSENAADLSDSHDSRGDKRLKQ